MRGSAELLAERLLAGGPDARRRDGRRAPAESAVRREIARGIGLVTGTRVDELDVVRYGRRSARHGALAARTGIPLPVLLAGYESCFATMQQQLWDGASAGDQTALRELTRRCACWLVRVCGSACDGYADELARTSRATEAVSALAGAMLLGHSGGRLGAVAGVGPAPLHQVLVGCRPPGGQLWPPHTAALLTSTPVLHCLDEGDLVLVAAAGVHDERVSMVIDRSAGAGVRWGRSEPVPPSRLPAALQTARRTAQLAYAAAAPAGVVTAAEDVVVEALSLADPVLRHWLQELAALLAPDPDLVRTVSMLYALDLDRGRTAARLGIARRTLNSRLTRVLRTTGLSPTTSTGIQVLGLALAAGRLAELRTAGGR